MANTIGANLDGKAISQRFFAAFLSRLAPVTSFATDFSREVLRGEKTVDVPLYTPKGSSDFTGSYDSSPDSEIDYRQVPIDQHKFATINLSDIENAESQIEFEEFAEQAAKGLADDVFQDMLSPLTVVDYYYEIVSTSANFDSGAVIDAKAKADLVKMPRNQRTLLLGDAYYNALIKDPAIKNSKQYGSAEAIQAGTIRNLYGSTVRQASSIPDNSEYLEGMLVYPTALALGMRYLQPQAPEVYTAIRALTDPKTGITIGLREWYEVTTGHRFMTFECQYGRAKGQEESCIRIVSTETLFSIDDEEGNSIDDEAGFAVLYK